MLDLGWFTVGVVVGVAVGCGTALGLWELIHRLRSGRNRHPESGRSVLAQSSEAAYPVSRGVFADGPAPVVPLAPTAEPASGPPPRDLRVELDPSWAPSRPPAVASPADYVLLSQRVVVHLARLGALDPNDIARPESCQQGIVEALSCPQSTLSRVLRKLALAGVVVQERRHVRGRDRRVYVYGLTARGEALARELRARRPGSTPVDSPEVSRAPGLRPDS